MVFTATGQRKVIDSVAVVLRNFGVLGWRDFLITVIQGSWINPPPPPELAINTLGLLPFLISFIVISTFLDIFVKTLHDRYEYELNFLNYLYNMCFGPLL